MPNYIQILKNCGIGDGQLPFCTFKIPQYSNKPAYSKFRNFLTGKIEKYEVRLTCNKTISALVADGNLYINADRCIMCMACLCSQYNPFVYLSTDITNILTDIIPKLKQLRGINPETLFDGTLTQIPRRGTLSLQINSFSQYTSENEVDRIAMWVTIMLQFLASDKNARVGKEIQIANPISPRDNRLDACCISHDKILIGETKNTVDSLLQENRYRIQIPSYQTVIDNLLGEHNALYGQHYKAMVLLIIGGHETDLLPHQHPQCTSIIGDRSQRFYDDIVSNNIKFVSANLLWIMAVHSLITHKRLCWDLFIPQVFSNPNVLGIVSGGQVMKQGKEVVLEAISPEILNSSVQDFF